MASYQLVDHRGMPIQSAVLKEEVAAPTMGSVRNIWSTHPAKNITPQRLARLLLEAEQAAPWDFLDLAEEMEEKDLHYLGVLGTRKRAVAQLEITVEAADSDKRSEDDAQVVRDWLKRDQLQSELFDILDAAGKGFSATEIIWDMSAKQWMPCALKLRDPRWFRFDQVDGQTLLMRDIGGDQPLPAFKFIDHRHPAKSGLPIRSGLARAFAWFWMFKNYTVKDWVVFAEVFGMPLRIGKHEVGETEDNIRKLVRAVSDVGTDAAAVISKSMDIEFLDGKGQSGQGGGAGSLYQGLAEYIDKQTSKLVLGQTATTDAIAGGHAVGKVHNEVRRDIMAADADLLQLTLNRDLVRPIVDLNNGPPPTGRYPRIVIGLPEAVDIKLLADTAAVLVPMGLKVPVAWIRGKIGVPEPQDSEEVLTVPRGAPSGGPGDPPESGADSSEAGEVAADPAEAASTRLLRLSGPLTRVAAALASVAKSTGSPKDAIDAALDGALEDWEPLARPLIAPLHELLAASSTLEEFRDGLAGIVDRMDADQVGQLLAQAGFTGRLAGKLGVSTLHEEDAR